MTTVEFSSKLLSLERSLLKFAYRLTAKEEDAKDLLQETYLKALLNKGKYVHMGNFKAWTFTIMRNTFINNYRSNLRQNSGLNPKRDALLLNQVESIADDPVAQLSAHEINSSIDQLQDKFRQPLRMYIDGFRYKEIAETLDLSLGTVKSRIFLSRKQLIAKLHK
jgi:RNA polymerase sigma-70 factor, ECF subfamily